MEGVLRLLRKPKVGASCYLESHGITLVNRCDAEPSGYEARSIRRVVLGVCRRQKHARLMQPERRTDASEREQVFVRSPSDDTHPSITTSGSYARRWTNGARELPLAARGASRSLGNCRCELRRPVTLQNGVNGLVPCGVVGVLYVGTRFEQLFDDLQMIASPFVDGRPDREMSE